MSTIDFKNERFDPDLTPFHDLAKSIATAFGYTADLELNPKLAQLIRLRVAQLNNCAYCLILHTKAARDQGILDAKVDGLGSWWESHLYSDTEKAALEYCEALTHGKDMGFQAKHELVAKHMSEREIAELAAVIINMNIWTRLKLAQGETPYFV